MDPHGVLRLPRRRMASATIRERRPRFLGLSQPPLDAITTEDLSAITCDGCLSGAVAEGRLTSRRRPSDCEQPPTNAAVAGMTVPPERSSSPVVGIQSRTEPQALERPSRTV